MTIVEVAGRRLALRDLRDNPDDHAAALIKARAEGVVPRCLCRPEGLRLVIRRREAGRCHLAGWPREAALHAPGCAFHRPDLDVEHTGRSSYSFRAIRETDSGTAISFAIPLTVGTTSATPVAPPSNRSGGRDRQRIGLLALLHWMWERAGLNSSSPHRPALYWRDCVREVGEQISDCTLNKQPFSDICYPVPPFKKSAADTNAAVFKQFVTALGTGVGSRRGLVLGELRQTTPAKHDLAYQLAHLRRSLFISPALDTRIRDSYPAAFSRVADHLGTHRVGLFVIKCSTGGYPVVVDAAFMLTTRQWIPADSSHEVVMADALAAAGRAFTKPLRYDCAEDTFPDFVATDTTPHTLIEVWGVRGRESYEQRKAIKREIYRRRGDRLIEWTVTDPLPTLESARSSDAC